MEELKRVKKLKLTHNLQSPRGNLIFLIDFVKYGSILTL